jgi:2,4-dienoyl-CoA reductase-like NADH-dependent reductase (Old Yellow Enzyme family)
LIEEPLTLPCGHTVANRICKAAMTEGLADAHDRATAAHRRLYSTWARGGAAILLSGNLMIDRRYLERSGNVVLEDDSGLAQLRAWAQTVREGGSQLWAQISHPGRQCPRLANLTPLAPSEIQLDMVGNFGKPRAATEADIQDIIGRFPRPPRWSRKPASMASRCIRHMVICCRSSCRPGPIGGRIAGEAHWPTGPACCSK